MSEPKATQITGVDLRPTYEELEFIATDRMNTIMELRELREGDNKLIRALAEDAGIKITAPDCMLGQQWEQFHDGVMALAKLREELDFIKTEHAILNARLHGEVHPKDNGDWHGMINIPELKQEVRELRAVVQGYDKVINQLPKEELVRFANAFPEKFREALAHKEDK